MPGNKRGFSLIEILISFALTVTLVFGMIQLTLHALFVKKRSERRLVSAELSAAKLEQLKSLPFDRLETHQDFEEDVDIRNPREIFHREWRILPVEDGIKKIEINCYSLSHVPTRTKMVLYVSEELGF